jgi:dTDP-4-amino-4,6-dideoxygalactose transaminase
MYWISKNPKTKNQPGDIFENTSGKNLDAIIWHDLFRGAVSLPLNEEHGQLVFLWYNTLLLVYKKKGVAKIQILKPELPKVTSIWPFFEKIDLNNVYSNYGPLYYEFREALVSWISNRSRNSNFDLTLTSNGTTAIELALRVEALETKKVCVMPSFTFVATAHAVCNAGLLPLLLDVDEGSLALTPEIVESLSDEILQTIACVIVVSVFGGPVDLNSWESFKRRTGIPVVVDYAAGVTSISDVSTIPLCISMHATKVLGIGEGGAIISSQQDKVERWTAMTGFGFSPQYRESLMVGGNYRLDEYSCAVGLAALQELDVKIEKLFTVANLYEPLIRQSGMKFLEGFGKSWISSTLNVIFDGHTMAKAATSRLDKESIPWRHWWGLGTHTHPAFKKFQQSDLGTTDRISPTVVGLPFHTYLSTEEIFRVGRLL